MRTALAVLGVLALAGCGSAAPSPRPAPPSSTAAAPSPKAAPAAAPTAAGSTSQITLCIPAKTDTTLPAFVARDAGYLAKEHIQASLPYFAGARVTQAMVAGECDFELAAGAEGAVLKGVDIVVIAVTGIRSPFGIWAQPRFKTLQDLKGHTLATSGPGSLSWRVGRFYLRQNHLVAGQDVKLFTVTGAGPTLAALLGGGVDAAVLSPPLSFEAQAKGKRLLYGGSRTPPFVVQTVTTTRKYLDGHQAVAAAVVKAVVQAMERLRSDRSFYGQELNRFTHLNVTGAKLDQYWQTARKEYNLPPVATRAEAVRALSLYTSATKSEKTISSAQLNQVASKWLDMSIVDRLFPPQHG